VTDISDARHANIQPSARNTPAQRRAAAAFIRRTLDEQSAKTILEMLGLR
jgi:hypothetical protein